MSGRSKSEQSMERWQLIWRAHRRWQAGRRIARDLKVDSSTVRYYLRLGPPPHDVKYDCISLVTDTDGVMGAFRVSRGGRPDPVSPPAEASGAGDKRGTTDPLSPGSPPDPLPPDVAFLDAARRRRA
jgi:hypothetical protein